LDISLAIKLREDRGGDQLGQVVAPGGCGQLGCGRQLDDMPPGLAGAEVDGCRPDASWPLGDLAVIGHRVGTGKADVRADLPVPHGPLSRLRRRFHFPDDPF
jgi:hypothetical protein